MARAVESLSTALSSSSTRNYNIAVRSFLVYVGATYQDVTRVDDLRTTPNLIGTSGPVEPLPDQ